MPHVVVEEAGDLQGLYQAFTPIVHRTGNEILKVQELYLSRSGKDALLESVRSNRVRHARSLSSSSCMKKPSLFGCCLRRILRKPRR